MKMASGRKVFGREDFVFGMGTFRFLNSVLSVSSGRSWERNAYGLWSVTSRTRRY